MLEANTSMSFLSSAITVAGILSVVTTLLKNLMLLSDRLFIIMPEADSSMPFLSSAITVAGILSAGTDTTYTVLEWAMTELLCHPKVMKELQNEIRRIAGDKPRITEDELDKMSYLKSVIKETLRLHPPIPLLVPRQTTQDVKIKGYDIAAGTQVIVNAWAIGRDNESWENPNEFNPKRFMNKCIDFKGHDFELIPFGAGRRGCPGIQFAMAINELVLANILHKFDWRLVDGEKEGGLNMIESSGLTIHRKFPLVVVPTRCC